MKTTKIILLSFLAYTVAFSVVLFSVHARDLAASNNGTVSVDTTHPVKLRIDDTSAKSVADLHSHVEKTVIKTFEKSTSDQTILIRQRQTSNSVSDTSRPLAVIMMEMLFMFRLTYAFALAH